MRDPFGNMLDQTSSMEVPPSKRRPQKFGDWMAERSPVGTGLAILGLATIIQLAFGVRGLVSGAAALVAYPVICLLYWRLSLRRDARRAARRNRA